MQSFTGIVRKGNQRGAALGYPTVNIPLTDSSVSGVYAAIVRLDKAMFRAAAFADPARGILEAHIFGFSEIVYGREISIELHRKIRDAERFEDDDALREAIAQDIEQIKRAFNS